MTAKEYTVVSTDDKGRETTSAVRDDVVKAVVGALVENQNQFPETARLFERAVRLHRKLPDTHGRSRLVIAPKSVVALRLDELIRSDRKRFAGIDPPLQSWLINTIYDLGVWGLPSGDKDPMEVQRELDLEALIEALDLAANGERFSPKCFAQEVRFEAARDIARSVIKLTDRWEENATTLGNLLRELEDRVLAGRRATCTGKHPTNRRVYWIIERITTGPTP